MDDLLHIRDLHVEFGAAEGTIQAVRGVNFRIRPGSTVALVGESGSGKSVVAQTIMGILPKIGSVTKGEVLFRDVDRSGDIVDIARLDRDSQDMRSIRGSRISIIFQEPMTSLSPVHTVGNQVGEALCLHRAVGAASGRRATEEMLELVGFPDPTKACDSYPFELSGGLRQRAMIAMALICRPALLIADEPTTALDVTIQAQILKLIRDLQNELGMATLIITHDLGVVANVAEEIVVMYHGQIMESGSAEDIFRRPEHPYLKALLRAVPRFEMADNERLVPIREIAPGDAVSLKQSRPWTEEEDKAGPLLEVGNLSKTFTLRKNGFLGGKDAAIQFSVRDVSFNVRRGECVGLVGESGCGKTTTSKMIMCALSPDSGSVTFNDHGRLVNVLDLSKEDLFAFRRKVQFIFQDPFASLNPRMTVFDILNEPLIIHKLGTPAERAELVRELMRLVGLDIRHLRRYPHSFSGGQRQRVGIARALALGPELLICDEPVSALDVSIQAQILNLLKDLQEELGLTYLFISHNLAVIHYIADRVAIMCAGRLVEIAPHDRLFRRPVHPYTKALLGAVPEPDLDHKLDFNALMAERVSDPLTWPAPFTISADNDPAMISLGDGHYVRAAETPALRMAS